MSLRSHVMAALQSLVQRFSISFSAAQNASTRRALELHSRTPHLAEDELGVGTLTLRQLLAHELLHVQLGCWEHVYRVAPAFQPVLRGITSAERAWRKTSLVLKRSRSGSCLRMSFSISSFSLALSTTTVLPPWGLYAKQSWASTCSRGCSVLMPGLVLHPVNNAALAAAGHSTQAITSSRPSFVSASLPGLKLSSWLQLFHTLPRRHVPSAAARSPAHSHTRQRSGCGCARTHGCPSAHCRPACSSALKLR